MLPAPVCRRKDAYGSAQIGRGQDRARRLTECMPGEGSSSEEDVSPRVSLAVRERVTNRAQERMSRGTEGVASKQVRRRAAITSVTRQVGVRASAWHGQAAGERQRRQQQQQRR